MKRTVEQNNAMYALFARLGIEAEEKSDLCRQFSGGRTERSSELTVGEAQNLIEALREQSPDQWEYKRKDVMRKRVISMAHEMGWELEGGKADMARINAWCVKYGHRHKPLQQHTYAELQGLVTQFQRVHSHFLNTATDGTDEA